MNLRVFLYPSLMAKDCYLSSASIPVLFWCMMWPFLLLLFFLAMSTSGPECIVAIPRVICLQLSMKMMTMSTNSIPFHHLNLSRQFCTTRLLIDSVSTLNRGKSRSLCSIQCSEWSLQHLLLLGLELFPTIVQQPYTPYHLTSEQTMKDTTGVLNATLVTFQSITLSIRTNVDQMVNIDQ
jgi:hypothetical protein